jgi:ArsR family transcriptional regulator, virulence genes transcriptional regulator
MEFYGLLQAPELTCTSDQESTMDATTVTAKATARRKVTRLPGRRQRGAEIEQLAAQAATAARMLKLLGNEYRLLILCCLIAHGETKVGDLIEMIKLSQSALSQHLARLRADGLVTYRRESQTLYYRVGDPRAARILKLLKNIYCDEL